MFPLVTKIRVTSDEATDVATGTGTRKIDGTTPIGELSQKGAGNGRAADIEVVSLAKGALEFVVTNQFGSVIKVGDTVTHVAGAATVAADTLVTNNEPNSNPDDGNRKITVSKAFTGDAADPATQLLKVTGNDFDIEKMTVDSLADGLAVKVKGDTFKRSGIPNSRFEILQQGFVPNESGGGHCEMQVREPVMLSTWSASNYCQGPGDYSLFLTISPDFASNLFYDDSGPSGEYAAQEAAINCSGDGSDTLLGTGTSKKIPPRTIAVSVESVELHVSYIHPATMYIPKSISIRWAPSYSSDNTQG